MLLSEAMRLGIALVPDSTDSRPFEFDEAGHVVACCAWGAAYIGACGLPTPAEIMTELYADPHHNISRVSGQALTDWVTYRLRAAIGVDGRDPAHPGLPRLQGHAAHSLADWIWMANDLVHWTREQVAAKLAELGL